MKTTLIKTIVLATAVAVTQCGYSASEELRAKLQAKIAEIKAQETADKASQKELVKPERPQKLEFNIGPQITGTSKPKKGDICALNGNTFEISEFLSADNAGFVELVSMKLAKENDTLVIANNEENKTICVKIVDDAHEYVDDDKLEAGLFRYLGVKNFQHSRLQFYEELPPAEQKDVVSKMSAYKAAVDEYSKKLEEYKTTLTKKNACQNGISSILEGMVEIPGKDWMLGRTEVTQAQWISVMGDYPLNDWYEKGQNLPAEMISWLDCQQFIKKLNEMTGLNFRLPTSEEWEYACLAGSKGDYGKRANGEEGPAEVMAWISSNSNNKPHQVATKEPNAWGLYDMHGNVNEWTSTRNEYKQCALRGGGYYYEYEKNYPASKINFSRSNYKDRGTGFRLALSID